MIVNNDSDMWDDTELLSAFHEAVQSHTFKNKKFNQIECDIPDNNESTVTNTTNNTKSSVKIDNTKTNKETDIKLECGEIPPDSCDNFADEPDEEGEPNEPQSIHINVQNDPHNIIKRYMNDVLYKNGIRTSVKQNADDISSSGYVDDCKEKLLNEMLMSFFECGYKTGRYHAYEEMQNQKADGQESRKKRKYQ